MNNTFDFSYFVPTPDTTANCALSRWNDGLMGLSDFLKSYMLSRQSLEFGFSRNLNIKELLNLAKSTVYDDNHKFDYVINYRKFGDIKANVCGFDIPIVDFNHPFLVQEVLRSATTNEIIDFLSPYKVGISHVYNCNSTLSESERVEATKDALDRFKTAIQDQTLISDDQLHIIFKKNNGNYRTRQQIINELDTAISVIDNLSSGIVDFIFGFESREKLESISGSYPIPGTTSYNTSSHDFYRDFCCNTYCCTSTGSVATFILNISDCYKQEFQDRYLTPFGIEFSYVEPLHYRRNANEKSHLLLFFKFDITEKPTIAPFVSHDGTLIPTTEQRFNIQYSLQYSKNRGTYILYKSYWDNGEECPVYFDAENVAHPMTLESNINGMGGRDYTFWSSPVQKTESGYQFECCMPLAFYNAESDSYSNEYYATNSHEGIEIGEVMYRVPVVKRMRQNIEEAIVNTHLTKCLGDLVPATNENAEDDDTVVLGGVVVDDFTEGLYPVAETHKIATETEYGEVKIVKVKDSDGDDNGVLDLMYHYSETGELSYDGMTMPETGRAVDMITLFDTLKDLGGGQPLKQQYFVVNGYNDHLVNVNVAESSFDGESSLIIDPFNIMLKNTWNDSNTGKECKEDITFMGDGQIYIRSESITDNKESVIHTEPSIVYMRVREKEDDSTITKSNIELSNSEFDNYGIKLSSSKKIRLESDNSVNVEVDGSSIILDASGITSNVNYDARKETLSNYDDTINIVVSQKKQMTNNLLDHYLKCSIIGNTHIGGLNVDDADNYTIGVNMLTNVLGYQSRLTGVILNVCDNYSVNPEITQKYFAIQKDIDYDSSNEKYYDSYRITTNLNIVSEQNITANEITANTISSDSIYGVLVNFAKQREYTLSGTTIKSIYTGGIAMLKLKLKSNISTQVLNRGEGIDFNKIDAKLDDNAVFNSDNYLEQNRWTVLNKTTITSSSSYVDVLCCKFK